MNETLEPMRDLSAAPERLLAVSREWPWGLVVLTDPGSSDPVPTDLDMHGIAAARSVVAASIQHAVDGEAVAEVWKGQPPGHRACIYEGEFVTVCGVVILGDAGYEQHAPADVGEATHQLRVFVDDITPPSRVAFSFTGPPAAE